MASTTTLKRRLTTALASLALAVGLLGIHAPAASAASWFDDTQWVRSSPSFNTRLVCQGYCLSYSLAMADIAWQGPQGHETEIPKVGERFYIRVRTSIVFPLDVQDSYRMRVLLPTGVTPDIRSNDDVLCAITDVSYNPTRNMPANECQDPVQSGLYQQFPPVVLDKGEVAWFFFPVKASQAMTDATGLGVESDLITNPWNALPDPLWSSMKLTVAPAPAASPNPQPTAPGAGQPGTPTGGSAPTTRTGTAVAGVSANSKRGKVILSWRSPAGPVSRYEVQLLRKGKWVKVAKVAGSAKKFTWKKGKPGKVYRFRVRTVSSAGKGNWSSVIRIRVK